MNYCNDVVVAAAVTKKMSAAQKCQHDMQQHGPQQHETAATMGKNICNWYKGGGGAVVAAAVDTDLSTHRYSHIHTRIRKNVAINKRCILLSMH